MKRSEVLQEVRKMRFGEAYEKWKQRRSTLRLAYGLYFMGLDAWISFTGILLFVPCVLVLPHPNP